MIVPSDALPTPSLESVTASLQQMTEDAVLETHLLRKFQKNWQSFPIPQNDEITALSKFQDGFCLGLRSGKVMFVTPPAARVVEMHQGPVIGLFAVSGFFIVTAEESCLRIWNAQIGVECGRIPCAVSVTCVTGNILKEVFFLGLANGGIDQYHVKNKKNCDIEVKFNLKRAKEESAVTSIKTNDSTSWVAARYVSNALILWDHMSGAMLYHFTFTAGPGLPNTWVLGETTNLPQHLEPNKDAWDVFPECLVFSSPLILRMSGSNVSKIYSTKRPVEPDDHRWQAYSENLRKGHISSWCEHTLVTITKPGATKKTLSEKVVSEVEIDLGLDFTLSERSEANNYLAFACPNSLEVICLSAIETTFVHQISGQAKRSKDQGYVYTRFQKLVNQRGETLLTLEPRERILSISPDSHWVICTSEKHGSKVSTSFKIKSVESALTQVSPGTTLPDKHNLSLSLSGVSIVLPDTCANDEFLRKAFSKDSSFLALLFTRRIVVYRLGDQSIVFTREGTFNKLTCRLKYARTQYLVLTDEKRLCVLYPDLHTWVELQWDFSRISFLNSDATEGITYNLSKTSRCVIEREKNQLTNLQVMSEGFQVVKTLNSHQHCAGLNDSGVVLFLAEDLTKLVHFNSGYQVTISKSIPMLFAFCSNASSSSYGMLSAWDLNLGLNIQTFSSGVNFVLNNSLTVKGPKTGNGGQIKSLNKLIHHEARIKSTWIINVGQFESAANFKPVDHESAATLGVYEEHFERQCIVWKKLAALVSTGELSNELTHVLLTPYNLNVLHILANNSQALALEQAMEAGASVIKSSFGSPVTLCIKHKSRKTLDTILFGLVKLRESNLTEFAAAVYQLNDDLLDMLSFGSHYLADFLKLVLIPLPPDVLANTVIKPQASLPDVQLSDNVWIDDAKYAVKHAHEKEKITVEYLISPLDVYNDMGSSNSLKVLQVLASVDDMGVFTAPFITQIIDLKWRKLWWVISVHTLLYWCLLIAMVCRMFDYGSNTGVTVVYLFLTCLFVLKECVKFASDPLEHFKHFWNYLFLCWAALTYSWIGTNYNSDLTFVVVLLSMFFGINTFEAFDHTRFYIRMIVDVIKATISFIWIFFYFTFAFGLLFEAACFQDNSNPMNANTTEYKFWNAWTTSMELNMGNFNVDGYGLLFWLVFMSASCIDVFIMLNLVVAVLGDAFDDFQSNSDAADVLKKIQLIYEYELLIHWRCGEGVKKRLQICQEEGGGNAEGDWKGKVEEVRKQLNDVENEVLEKMKEEMKKSWKKMKKESTEEDEELEQLGEVVSHMKSEVRRLANLVQGRGKKA